LVRHTPSAPIADATGPTQWVRLGQSGERQGSSSSRRLAGRISGNSTDTATAALRLEQLLVQAEQDRRFDSEIEAELEALGEKVDPDDLEQAVEDTDGMSRRPSPVCSGILLVTGWPGVRGLLCWVGLTTSVRE
jgi:hypothetical protein